MSAISSSSGGLSPRGQPNMSPRGNAASANVGADVETPVMLAARLGMMFVYNNHKHTTYTYTQTHHIYIHTKVNLV